MKTKVDFSAGFIKIGIMSCVFMSISSRADCVYSFVPEKTNIEWIAYKTTKKVPVSGSFKKFASKQRKELESLLSEIKKTHKKQTAATPKKTTTKKKTTKKKATSKKTTAKMKASS